MPIKNSSVASVSTKIVAALVTATILGVASLVVTGVIGNTNRISVMGNDIGYLKQHVRDSNTLLESIITKLDEALRVRE